jgi:hypothetical protein
LLMFDRIFGEDNPDVNILKNMELQFKMKIKSGSEGAVLNALRFARPQLLHKGRPTRIVPVGDQSRLNLQPTYAAWNPGGDGIKDHIIEKRMNALQETLSAQISHEFPMELTAYWIASKR